MKLSKRIAALGVAALIAGACNSAASPAASGGGGSADRSGILIEVVTHGQASDPFWSIFKNGVDQAGKDMGVKVEYSAPRHVRHAEDGPADRRRRGEEAGRPRGLDPGQDRPRPVDPEAPSPRASR